MKCTWRWTDALGVKWGCRAATDSSAHSGSTLCAHHQRDRDVEARIREAVGRGDASIDLGSVPGEPTGRGFPEVDTFMYRIDGGRR